MGKKNKKNSKVVVKAMLNDRNSVLPMRQHKGDAGFDLTSIDTGTIEPGYSTVFGTGLHVEVPEGFVMLVFPRSGLGIKHGVTLSNSVGVIDSGYRGEVKVGLVNLGKRSVTIHTGDRIAQAIVIELPKTKFVESFVLGNSLDGRDTDGFGSTDEPKTDEHESKGVNNRTNGAEKPEGKSRLNRLDFSVSLFKDNPVEYTDAMNNTLKFMNPTVAAIWVLRNIYKEKDMSRKRLANCENRIKSYIKGNERSLVLGISWRASDGGPGTITPDDLDSIPDSLLLKRRVYKNGPRLGRKTVRKVNKGSVVTKKADKRPNHAIKAYNGKMLIRTFKSANDAVDWLNNNNPVSMHYRRNIMRVLDTNNTAYGYKWESKSVNWVV